MSVTVTFNDDEYKVLLNLVRNLANLSPDELAKRGMPEDRIKNVYIARTALAAMVNPKLTSDESIRDFIRQVDRETSYPKD